MKTMTAVLTTVAISAGMLLGGICYSADEARKTSATPVIKTVSGEISAISKHSVSIVYSRDQATGTEYEMLIPLSDGMAFNHMKSMSDAKVGDKISVEYQESTDTFGGVERTKKSARAVSFVSSAPPAPVDPEEEEYKAQKQAGKGK